MEAMDYSQLSGAMLAFLWEEFMKRAHVPAETVDIVLLRLGLSLDSSGQQREELRAAHERWSTSDTLITLEDFISVVVPVINDEIRSASAEERELRERVRELQAWHEDLGPLLSHRFCEMLLFGNGGSDSEPDTISMNDGRDGGDGSGTLTGPMTNSVIIDGGTGVPETTEEGYTSSLSLPDSEATLVLPTHDSTPAPQRGGGFEMGPEMSVSATLPPPPAKRDGLAYEFIATNIADVVEFGHRWPNVTYLPSLRRL